MPIHPSVLVANRSRFLADLFGPDFADGSRGEKGASASAVPVSPPCPELFLRALHSITTRARPEVLEDKTPVRREGRAGTGDLLLLVLNQL